jgi:ubiquitin carboxyl-terminal hydrolase 14
MKPVAFSSTLDVYDFCTPEVQKTLQAARKKALAAEEDKINKKLKGQVDDDEEDHKMETDEEAEEDDEDLQAALAMSMGEEETFVGPGLPKDFQGYYELFAVVTHKGRDADGGHYMSWVKAATQGEVQKIADTDEDNEDWFVFDDDEVSPCKTEDVLKLKGGGDWHMSYLNFYRAKK